MVLEKISDFSTNEMNAFFIQIFYDHVLFLWRTGLKRTADKSYKVKPKLPSPGPKPLVLKPTKTCPNQVPMGSKTNLVPMDM